MTDQAILTNDDGEPLAYAAAAAELDTILAELESSTIDVDALASRVERASALIRHCRHRLDAVRHDVDRVVTELEDGDA